jgi:cobalt transporter subunit CbtA
MLLTRLIWVALAVAVLVGSVQSALHQWQAVPIILAAEVFEDHKSSADTHTHADAPLAAHEHAAHEWAPADGFERGFWTWVADVLHALAMALLTLAALGLWVWREGLARSPLRLGLGVAAAGWLSLHLWPALGLPAELPGMAVADLAARQGWWVLAAGSAALACGLVAFGHARWRWPLAALCLALPQLVGAPHLAGDALAGFDAEARAQMVQLEQQFLVVTTWLSALLWLSLGLACAAGFTRWIAPLLPARPGAHRPPQPCTAA